MATRGRTTRKRTTSRPARRATATKRTTLARASKGGHPGDPVKDVAHGYVMGVLKEAPKDGTAAKKLLDSVWTALQAKNAKYPTHKAEMTLSLMEVTDHHGTKKVQIPGKDVFIFIWFPHQLPPGNSVAHDRIHDLASTIDPHNNAAFGLSNHWCCYSDA